MKLHIVILFSSLLSYNLDMKSTFIFIVYFLSYLSLYASFPSISMDNNSGILVWFYSIETKPTKEYGHIYKLKQSAGVDYPSNKIDQILPLNKQSKIIKNKDNNFYLTLALKKIRITDKQPLFLGQIVSIKMSDTSHIFIPKKFNIPIDSVQYNSDLTKYLIDRADLLIYDKEIVKIKNELLKNNSNILDYITAVDIFVHKQFRYRKPKRPNSAVTLLNETNGWCGEYTKLKLSLLRSAGIASRDVYASQVGIRGPSPDNKGSSKVHAWIQAYIPNIGWISIPSTRHMSKHKQFVLMRGKYYLRAFDLYQHEKLVQQYKYSTQNLKKIGGTRGNGMFFNIDSKYILQIQKTTHKILNYQQNISSTIFSDIKNNPKAIQPLLYWFLISNHQKPIFTKATKLFIESLQKNPHLDIDMFYLVGSLVVKQRITNYLKDY